MQVAAFGYSLVGCGKLIVLKSGFQVVQKLVVLPVSVEDDLDQVCEFISLLGFVNRNRLVHVAALTKAYEVFAVDILLIYLMLLIEPLLARLIMRFSIDTWKFLVRWRAQELLGCGFVGFGKG